MRNLFFSACWLFTSLLFSPVCDATLQTVGSENQPQKSIVSPLIIDIGANRAPFTVVLASGQPTGLYVEFWQLWSQYSNTPIEFQVNGFQNIRGYLESGKIDFQSGLFRNEEREEWGDFSIPFHSVDSGLYYLQSDFEKPNLSQLNREAHDAVAVHRNSFQSYFLKKNYPKIPLVYYKEASDVFDRFLSGEIRAILAEQPYMDSQIAGKGLQGLFKLGHAKILANGVYAVVKKGNKELLDKINQGIRMIPVAELIALEKKWLPDSDTFFTLSKPGAVLTTAQVSWLKKLPKLKIGTDPLWYPYDFINSKGQHDGLSADYLLYLNEHLPIETEVQTDLTWNEAFEQIKKGKIDLLSAVVRTPEREKYLNFTTPYASFPSVVATYKNSIIVQNMSSLNGLTVGIEKGLILEDVFRKNHPEVNLLAFETLEQAIIALENEKISALVTDLASINQHIIEDKLTNISIAAFTPYELELSIGVRKGLEPLVPILNDALAQMTIKQKSAITTNWFGAGMNDEVQYMEIIKWVLPISSVLFAIILFVNFTNKKLRSEILVRKEIEHSLSIEKEKSDLANRAKNDFLANMSHEIRTPMNAVVGMADLMSSTALTEEQIHFNDTIKSATASLLVIINDILDLSKIEAGKLEFDLHPFSVQDLVKKIRSQSLHELEGKSIDISIKFDEKIPTLICGDSTRLGQILVNLVHNAIKFTQQGDITIEVIEDGSDAEKIGLEFCVTDTGIGISDEAIGKLFKSYGQADASTTRNYGGTGLGLSICKQLCEMMGGGIWVDSEFGVGSRFFFTAFFKPVENIDNKFLSESKVAESRPDFSLSSNKSPTNLLLDNRKILLVDDNQVNLFIAKKMLINAGAYVVTAENGQAAIDILKSETFDLLLLDIQMPVMDGYQTTKIIRNELHMNKLPIVAITANVLDSDVKMAKTVGINAHLGKPFDQLEMISLVKKLLDDNLPAG